MMAWRMVAWVLVVLLAACGGPRADEPERTADGRIVITFWHAMGGRQGASINEIADAFNGSQDRYEVVPINQGRYDNLSQKLIASAYAGRQPAIAQMYPGWAKRFHNYGYLLPVEELAAADPGYEGLRDFWPVMIEENTMKNPRTGEQELITLPFNKSVYVLYINQTRMEEVGYREPPETWEELREVAGAMARPAEGDRPAMAGFGSRPYIEDFTVQAFAAGVPLVDEESGELLLDSEPARAALAFLGDLTSDDEGIGYVDAGYLSGAFGSGRIGMYISSTASFPFNDSAVGNKFVWMAYPIPSRDADTAGKTLMQGTNVGVFAGLAEEEQRGAWEFLKFLTSPEMTAKWAMDTGYMPVRESALELPEMAVFLEENPRYANAVSALPRAAFEPRLIYWETVRSIISREVEAFLLGRKGLEAALGDARRAIERTRERAA